MASSTHPSHRAIRIDGRSIRLGFSTDRAGSPPALLLLHGAGMDHRVWAEQLALLGDRGIVASAPDLPGHGGSEGPALTRIAEMADWVLRLVDGIGSREVALAGHSMGALVALEAAGRLGSRLSGLALIGAAAEMPVNPDLLEAASRDLPRAAKMIAAWGYGPAAQADGRAEAGRRIIEAAPPGVLATDLAACAAYREAPAAAARISARTLVISGSRDRMTPARRGRALADAIAGAQFQELPEVGHMPMAEAPAELSAALIRLLR